jgi:hypothetical protein
MSNLNQDFSSSSYSHSKCGHLSHNTSTVYIISVARMIMITCSQPINKKLKQFPEVNNFLLV